MKGQLHLLGILTWKGKNYFCSSRTNTAFGKAVRVLCDTSACSCPRWHTDFHASNLHKFTLFSPDGKFQGFIRDHLLDAHKPELDGNLPFI